MSNFPKIHNAMWPGLVGRGPNSEPPIDLDTMLNLTAAAGVGGLPATPVRGNKPDCWCGGLASYR